MGTSRGEQEANSAVPQVEDAPEMFTFEDIMERTGTRGPWNILIFCMCGFAMLNLSLHQLSYQFLGATPDHWCSVEILREANWTQHQILSLAIPISNSTRKYASCNMYDYNYTTAAEIGYDAAMANRWSLGSGSDDLIKCYSRDFNLTQYQSTVVTEWDLVCERRVLYSTTQSAVMGGNLAGNVIFGYCSDAWGRRRSALISASLFILSTFVTIVSPNEEAYIVMRFLISMMGMGMITSLFVFMMETCAVRYRSAAGALVLLPWAFGYLVVSGIAYLLRSWRLLQLGYSCPSLLGIAFFVWLPESPRWLIMRGRHTEALKVLKKAAKLNGKTLPPDDKMMSAMTIIGEKSDTREEGEKKASLPSRVLLWLRRLAILLILPQYRTKALTLFVIYFCSCMVYYGVSFSAHNVNADPYLYMFLGGVSEAASSLLLWLVLVRLGRRISLVVLLLVCGVTSFGVMALILTGLQGMEWAMLTLSQVGKLAIAAAFQLLWVYSAELHPTKYRSSGLGLGNAFARMGGACSTYINDLMGAEQVWAPSALFGLVSLVSSVLTLLLPETRHLNLTEPKGVQTTDEKQEEAVKEFQVTSRL